ncbi:hypothetical protein BO83DRAFT_36624 [Aspergillus eucalypticola CBS 122712]|uniref:Uncharacterized protein n=1 Tax=Aspergillus eucalypticola (strain CBS 122712 / IBT 29274) TaxID=1448314 RepID=A0A317VHY6_ASPEC|nr:uncharacterized protein BO83DRAFT_36624 [Aspergillus eucalypticola CBS 122712]PWY72628.1 hypothetical protein BO83DRAFT_36624 [Aspergillus eucalypticola CBS 122712]
MQLWVEHGQLTGTRGRSALTAAEGSAIARSDTIWRKTIQSGARCFFFLPSVGEPWPWLFIPQCLSCIGLVLGASAGILTPIFVWTKSFKAGVRGHWPDLLSWDRTPYVWAQESTH